MKTTDRSANLEALRAARLRLRVALLRNLDADPADLAAALLRVLAQIERYRRPRTARRAST